MSFIPGANVGPYRIVEQAERNGIATAYTAYQPSLGRYVQIIVLPTLPRDDVPRLRERQRQLELIASLRHPNVLTVLDHGEHLGVTFVVTELVDASPLTERLGPPWPLSEVVRVLRPIAAALDYAHEQGVVHGDVRPSAILLALDGTPILAGFGQAVGPAPASIASRPGEPGPRDPAVLDAIRRGQEADRRGLALIAYEMLTGRLVDVAPASFDEPLPPAQLGSPLLSRPVEAALLRELAGQPSERYPTASAFVAALATPLAPPAATSLPAAPGQHVEEGWRRWLAVVLVFAAVAVLGAIVALARGGLIGRPVAPPVAVDPTAASAGTASTVVVQAVTSTPPAAGGATPGASAADPAATGQPSAPPPVRQATTIALIVPTPDLAGTPAAAAPVPPSAAPPTPAALPTPPPGPAPTVPPAPAATMPPGRVPPSWRVTGDPSGRWTMDESGRVFGRVEDGASLLLFPDIVDDVDFAASLTTTSCQATLVFRAQDEQDLLLAIYIPDGLPNPTSTAGGLWLYQRVEGLDIPIRAVRPLTVRPAGQPVRLRITTDGPRITLLLDDEPAMQAIDTAPHSGRLGLMVYSAGGRVCEASFEDIQR